MSYTPPPKLKGKVKNVVFEEGGGFILNAYDEYYVKGVYFFACDGYVRLQVYHPQYNRWYSLGTTGFLIGDGKNARVKNIENVDRQVCVYWKIRLEVE